MFDTIKIGRLSFSVDVRHDEGICEPWKEHDGHGPVSDWTDRGKRPGEVILCKDRGKCRYYDMAESVRMARSDGWGSIGDEGLKPGEKAARAAQKDYEYLRSWCNDEWHWVYIVVTLLDANGRPTHELRSLGGMESTDTEGIETAAKELAAEIAEWIGEADALTIPILQGVN